MDNNIRPIDMIKLFIYKYGIVHMILLLLITIELILDIKGYSINKNAFYRSKESPLTILPWMYMFYLLIGPMLEEFFFRDILLNFLRKYGVKFAIITQALIFGLLHKNVMSIVHVSVSGIFYGYIAVMTNSILPTIILHIIHNSFSVLIGTTILKNADLISPMQIIMAIIYVLVAIIVLYYSNWKVKLGDKVNIDVKNFLFKKQSR